MTTAARDTLRTKLRFLLGQQPTEVHLDLIIDLFLAWSNQGQKRVMTQGQIEIGQYSDPISSSGNPVSLSVKPPRKYKAMSAPAGFEEFWAVYWRRVKRAKAILAWSKIDPDPKLTQVIVAAVKAQRKEQLDRELKFRTHATTWLNGREWENETNEATTAQRNTSPARLPEVKGEAPGAKERVRASWTQPESAGALLDGLPGWADGGKP